MTIERIAGRDIPVHEVGARRLVSLWALVGDDEARRSALRLAHGRAIVRWTRDRGGVVEGLPLELVEDLLAGDPA